MAAATGKSHEIKPNMVPSRSGLFNAEHNEGLPTAHLVNSRTFTNNPTA